MLKKEGVTLARYKFQNYIKELYYDSDTTMTLLSGASSSTVKNLAGRS